MDTDLMGSFLDITRSACPSISMEEIDIDDGRFYRIVSDSRMTPFLSEQEMKEIMVRYVIVMSHYRKVIDENIINPVLHKEFSEVKEDTLFDVLLKIINVTD